MKKRIVIKLGSSSLTDGRGKLSQAFMIELVRQVNQLHKEGHEVIIVSSGAVAAAKQDFPAKSVGECIPSKQMLAAIGQVRLIHTWSTLFSIYEMTIGQVLLTRSDVSNEVHAKNAQNTLLAMLEHRVIPILNENDTVAIEELRVGDNDNLSALVARLINADLLILLTDQEGFYTADPRHHADARLISHIHSIDESFASFAQDTDRGGVGTGGMVTKLEAAKHATQGGIATVIASSKAPNVLLDLISGKPVGTFFSV